MRAVLALDGIDSKKHSGIISAFRQNYIKTGEFEAVYSDVIKDAFGIRTDSDYQDFYTVSKADAQQQIDDARAFLEAVTEYVNNKKCGFDATQPAVPLSFLKWMREDSEQGK